MLRWLIAIGFGTATALLLAACSPSTSPGSPTPAAVASPAPSPSATAPLAASSPVPSPTPGLTQVPSRVFPPSSCEPPCWLGITPGRTTIAEAVKILGEPDKKTKEVVTDGKMDGSYVWGYILQPTSRGLERIDWLAQLLFEHSIVKGIVLGDPNSSETAADVVARYGPPENVFVNLLHPEMPVWHIVLVYPSRGMTFTTDWNRSSPYQGEGMPPVTKRDVVFWRGYYEPTTLAEVQRNDYGQDSTGPAGGGGVKWEEIPD